MAGREKDPVTPVDESSEDLVGKGRPTPKRKTAEAANKRPLVPTTSARRGSGKPSKADRDSAREQRNAQYRAMQTGDVRNMPAQHRGDVRTYVRDYVDGRFNLGEFFLPVAALFLVLQIVLAGPAPSLAALVILVLYVYVLFAVADGVIMWRGLKKRLEAKFGAGRSRGNVMYALMRAFALRPTRMPKPRVKRGTKPA